ncbi:MAG: O-antigen ligase family protein [bacterium]|jgi:O-antigen ligase|nr:O-antigen ligase family protein [bacterium]
MLERFLQILFLIAIFLLPWQTQAIFGNAVIEGQASVFGVFGLYVVEALIATVFLFRARQQIATSEVRKTWQALYYFLGFVFFSLGLTGIALVGWFYAIHVVSAAFLFFLLTDSRTNLKKVAVLFVCGLCIPVILGWIQVLTGGATASTFLGVAAKEAATLGVSVIETGSGRLLRAHGTFPHPNIFGGWLAMGLILIAWLVRFVESRWQLVLLLGGAGVLASTLVVTFSRSAWLGLLGAFLILLVGMWIQKKKPRKRLVALGVVGLVCVFATVLSYHDQVLARFTPSLPLETISLEERASQYEQFGDVFVERPLFGVGPNAYTFVLAQQDPGQDVWAYQPVHNVFLLLLAELGVMGFGAFLYLVFSTNPFAHASLKKVGGVFALALGAVFFMVGLFDHYLWTLWPGLALSAFGFAYIVRWQTSS